MSPLVILMTLLLSLHWSPLCTSQQNNLKIAAFNMQIFGTTKVNKPDVVASLVKVSIIWFSFNAFNT